MVSKFKTSKIIIIIIIFLLIGISFFNAFGSSYYQKTSVKDEEIISMINNDDINICNKPPGISDGDLRLHINPDPLNYFIHKKTFKSLGPLIPRPAYYRCSDGIFNLSSNKHIYVESCFQTDELIQIGEYLASKLRPSTGFLINIFTTEVTPSNGIYLKIENDISTFNDEGYTLNITEELITLSAGHPKGLFRGIQTIRQLLPTYIEDDIVHPGPWLIKCGYIEDEPSLKWRGFMFDVCRHFFSVEKVKQYIDLLAYYKMNVFHWHLTDDQGWRCEIESHPLLNTIGSYRGEDDYGGYYTKEEMIEVVEYAADRYIEVIPEIEMPGHCVAALASYPWLMCDPVEDINVSTQWGVHSHVYCPGKNTTIDFLKTVLDEIVEMFPSPFIHIGGDEVPKSRWENCTYCQARMAEEDLEDEEELQHWFIKEIAWYLKNKHNRSIIGWSEGGVCEPGLPPDCIGQYWRVGYPPNYLAIYGYDVINSRFYAFYLDRNFPLATMYNYNIKHYTPDPYLHHILGAEAPIWTEFVSTENYLDDRVFPRLIAVAENSWTPDTKKDYNDFYNRLMKNLECLDYFGINYGSIIY